MSGTSLLEADRDTTPSPLAPFGLCVDRALPPARLSPDRMRSQVRSRPATTVLAGQFESSSAPPSTRVGRYRPSLRVPAAAATT